MLVHFFNTIKAYVITFRVISNFSLINYVYSLIFFMILTTSLLLV